MTTTKPALPEPVAWLHDVVATDGEPDHALSFAPDNFPLQGVGGFRSIGCQPLYTQAAIDAAVAEARAETALGVEVEIAATSPAEQPKPVDEAACRARCDYCGDDWPCAKQRADEQPKPEVRDLLLEARDTLCSMTTVGTYVDDLIRRIDAALSGEQP